MGSPARSECPFSSKCYRRNPHHFREFSHPHLEELLEAHPNLQLPDNLATTSISREALQEQLVIFRDIEKGFQRNPGKRLEQDTKRNTLNLKGSDHNNSSSPPPNSTKPKNLSSLDDGADSDLEEALRRSLVDQGGSSSASLSKAFQNEGKIDLEKPESSKEGQRNLGREGVDTHKKSPAPKKRPHSPDPSTTDKRPPSKLTLIQRRLDASEPYRFLLTKVQDCPESHRDSYSIFLADLLCPSLGQLAASLQINFMVELGFLTMCYELHKVQDLPLVILYGAEDPDLTHPNLPSNIRAIRVKPKYPFGTHHTKMMVMSYKCGGVRVVVHTANLVSSDWMNRTQGLWVSPLCPKLKPVANGESSTGFKSALLRYLKFYEVTAVHQFVSAIEASDMSSINVSFVSSVPGSHRDSSLNLWGQKAVAKLLRSSIAPSTKSWRTIAQASSIGSLGPTPDSWLEGELGKSFGCSRLALIYPSLDDVLNSYDGRAGGGCLPYSRKTAEKQLWLGELLHRWRADSSHRTRAPPHIKSYTREQEGKLAFFMLTSANVSKAAWGSISKDGSSCMIMSYEAGVVWLPATFSKEFFTSKPFKERRPGTPDFPLHYDLPITPYSGNQRPWLMDYMMQ